jgi:hypothetical protein
MANFTARMERIRPPRWVHVRFPRGAMFGEPGNGAKHRAVLEAVLREGAAIGEPGGRVELPYRWEAAPVAWRGREIVEGP